MFIFTGLVGLLVHTSAECMKLLILSSEGFFPLFSTKRQKTTTNVIPGTLYKVLQKKNKWDEYLSILLMTEPSIGTCSCNDNLNLG